MQAAIPTRRLRAVGLAVPVSCRAEYGPPAGTVTVTASRCADNWCSNTDPVTDSSSGLPSRPSRTGARTGTRPGQAGSPGRSASSISAVAALASAVLASSAREGPGSTSKSMTSI